MKSEMNFINSEMDVIKSDLDFMKSYVDLAGGQEALGHEPSKNPKVAEKNQQCLQLAINACRDHDCF